jgi:alpha-L-fucosidase
MITDFMNDAANRGQEVFLNNKGANPFTITGTSGWNAAQVKSVRLLGSDSAVTFEMTEAGLQITPPTDLGSSVYAWSFEIVSNEQQHHPNTLVNDADKALNGTRKVDLEGSAP